MFIPYWAMCLVAIAVVTLIAWCGSDVTMHREKARTAERAEEGIYGRFKGTDALHAGLTAENETLRQEGAVLREWQETLERKVREQYDVILGVMKERDVWHDWYKRDSLAYGAAQHMMMQALEQAERRLAAAGKAPPRDPQIDAIQARLEAERTAGAAAEKKEHPLPDPPVKPEGLVAIEAGGRLA